MLEISDNGCGISGADMEKPKSFGLRGIRERVSSLAGEFSITPGRQGGTDLVLRIPENPDIERTSGDQQQSESQRKLF
ncbi:MAG: hypothetical protein IPO13_04060 [Rhodocyclaceae bacterium]|nr:hypothetical protein [Rhodocyclaceae bacterium]